MASASDRSQHLFVVRVWHEVSHVAPIVQWRGSVEHVTSGQRQFFADLHEIDRFIRTALTKAEGNPAGEAPRTLPKPQVTLVQESFRQMQPHLDELGLRVHAILFERAPELRSRFGQDVGALVGKFTTMLTVIVEGIDDFGRIEPIVQSLGRRHAGYGARREHYTVLGEALLRAIHEKLGPRATAEVLKAWAATYALVADTMLSAPPQR